MILCGSKTGKILVYSLATGTLIAEIESAHYLAITDMDVSNSTAWQGDLIITAGKDAKVKIWTLTSLLSFGEEKKQDVFGDGQQQLKGLYAEYGAVSYTHLTLPTNREV